MGAAWVLHTDWPACMKPNSVAFSPLTHQLALPPAFSLPAHCPGLTLFKFSSFINVTSSTCRCFCVPTAKARASIRCHPSGIMTLLGFSAPFSTSPTHPLVLFVSQHKLHYVTTQHLLTTPQLPDTWAQMNFPVPLPVCLRYLLFSLTSWSQRIPTMFYVRGFSPFPQSNIWRASFVLSTTPLKICTHHSKIGCMPPPLGSLPRLSLPVAENHRSASFASSRTVLLALTWSLSQDPVWSQRAGTTSIHLSIPNV